MSFNPLGTYDPTTPISDVIKAARDAYVSALPTCPSGTLKRIYGHWTVGHYGQDFNDYNGAIRYDGSKFHLDICGDPRDNAIGVNNNAPHSHTYMRNTGAFGIATDDMAFADQQNFGPEPITMSTIEWLCCGIAAVAIKYDIDILGLSTDSPYANEPNFLTHGEAANRPGSPAQYANYYVTGERWDWCTFVVLPAGMTNADIDPSICGDALRHRAHLIKAA